MWLHFTHISDAISVNSDLSFQTIYSPFCYIHFFITDYSFPLFFLGQVIFAFFPLLEVVTLHDSPPKEKNTKLLVWPSPNCSFRGLHSVSVFPVDLVRVLYPTEHLMDRLAILAPKSNLPLLLLADPMSMSFRSRLCRLGFLGLISGGP